MIVKTKGLVGRVRELRPDDSWYKAVRGGTGDVGWAGTITHSATAPQAAYYSASAAMTAGGR